MQVFFISQAVNFLEEALFITKSVLVGLEKMQQIFDFDLFVHVSTLQFVQWHLSTPPTLILNSFIK